MSVAQSASVAHGPGTQSSVAEGVQTGHVWPGAQAIAGHAVSPTVSQANPFGQSAVVAQVA